MTTTLKFTNKAFSLILLLAMLFNLTALDLSSVASVHAKPEQIQDSACELYPIALPSQLLTNVKVGDKVDISTSDSQSGTFGWLSWTGNPSASRLAASLTAPGDSNTYVNPDDAQDHQISIGDWVRGMPGLSNSKDVGKALDLLKTRTIVVPVWNTFRGGGNNSAYRVVSFAQIQILDYQLSKENRISAKFLGEACADDGNEKGDDKSIVLKVSKTVDSSVISSELNSSLSVDKESAIPGDILTYTTSVSKIPTDFVLTGNFTVTNLSEVPAKIAYFYDLVSFKQTETGTWKNLAGYSTGLSGYTPGTPVPLNTGMTFSATGLPSTGVTYPAQGNGITGTVMASGSTATWKYTATLSLTPDQLNQLLDSAEVNQVLNDVHFEAATETLENGQSFNAQVDFTTALQSQSRNVDDVPLQLTLPDGNPVTPILVASETVGVYSATNSYNVPPLTARAADETEAEYLARLLAANGSGLTAKLDVSGQPQSAASTTLKLPIVTIEKDGPSTIEAGKTASYNLTLNNVGSAPAYGFLVKDLVSNGNEGAVSGTPETLAGGEQTLMQAAHTVAFPQTLETRLPEFLTDVASLTWEDANGNVYGSFSDYFTSNVVSPYSSMNLYLSPEGAGLNFTGSDQTLTATVRDQQQNPVPGVMVHFVIDGPNAGTLTQTTGENGDAVVSYSGAMDGLDNITAYVITGFTPLVSNTTSINWITPDLHLSPEKAGPNLTGTTQTLTAKLLDQLDNPVPGISVQLVIEGPNTGTLSGVTGEDGSAVVTYTGVNFGFDNVTARVDAGSNPLVSNTATIHWITPVKPVTTSVILGQFFPGVGKDASFNVSPGTVPAFTQVFPAINFNPPNKTVLGENLYVGPSSRPPADVTMDLYGYNAGTIRAHGNGYEAAVGVLSAFSAVFTGELTVAEAGDFTFGFYSDDGFIFGIGNGATRRSGEWSNAPASGTTAFENYPIMGTHNSGSGTGTRYQVVVNFPKPGVYPYEIDYTEIGGSWHRSLTMLNTAGLAITPSTSFVINPHSGQYPVDTTVGVPKAFTVTALDASGEPLVGLPVTLYVRGVNNQDLTAVTDSSGVATFTYTSAVSGVDVLQAVHIVDSKIVAITAEVRVSW